MIPAPEYINSTMVKDGRTNDIIENLAKVQPVAANQLREFSAKYLKLANNNPLNYAFLVASYIQKHFKYRKDTFLDQNIQLPARLNADKYGDCKSFSLFFSGAMSAAGIENGFRFCAYRPGNFTHVYNFIVVNGKKHIFDTCVPGLKETKHLIHEDMNVNVLSGPDKTPYRAAQKLYSVTMINPQTRRKYGLNVRAENAEAARAKIVDVMTGIGDPEEYIGKRSKAERKANRQEKKAGRKEKRAVRKEKRKENKPFRKVALAPGRGAMLTLIKLNVRNWAVKLSKLDQASVKDFWKRVGGDYNKLKAAIDTGKTKRRLLGPEIVAEDFEALGDPATATAALVTAAPIIAALVKLFKAKGVSDKDDAATEKELVEDGVEPLGEGFEVTDPSPGSEAESAGFGAGKSVKSVKRTTDSTGSDSDGAGDGGSFELSPVMLGLGALGLYFLTKK